MEQEVVEGFLNLRLTKDEETEIPITTRCRADLLEECSLSLFGRLLSDRQQNQRALKNTLRAVWKTGPELRIIDVGNNTLQFKFGSNYQMAWVENSGPWNFENNLLLLCRWKKGLTAENIAFTHSPFWVQLWGLAFEHMAEDVGRDIGNSIGRFIEMDKRAIQSDQAKFMRIRVDLPIDKPLRRGGNIVGLDGEKFWVKFKYERLPTFCYYCGRMGHDDKHCHASLDTQSAERQYGDWLRAYGNARSGNNMAKSSSNNTHGTSSDGTNRGGASSSGLHISKSSTAPAMSNQEHSRTGTSMCQEVVGKEGRGGMGVAETDTVQREGPHGEGSAPIPMDGPDLSTQEAFDALSNAGRSMKQADGPSEVANPCKPNLMTQVQETSPVQNITQKASNSHIGKGKMKKIAREKGLSQTPASKAQNLSVGIKRIGSLIFPESEGSDARKKFCDDQRGNSDAEVLSAAAAEQRRREP